MKSNYIDDLIRAVARVVTPNVPLLKEVLVIGGMPEKTQNLKYLSYNRNTTIAKGRSLDFSAVAVINNRRIDEWRLTGYSEKISRWVFSNRWTRNPLDLFLNNLRCNQAIMAVLDRAHSNYTLLGILTVTDLQRSGLIHRRGQYICPVVAIPDVDADDLRTIQAFETANQIKKTGLMGLRVYHKNGDQMGVV
ncbi:uncharacterized protein Dvar_37260 [Desulfosarcina variabilis str. Montpellier]|uniref:hypothetical protein n=1 Tax=Desulfosarcina variabilis TaxID=2300 RepID=UPI003AFB16B3